MEGLEVADEPHRPGLPLDACYQPETEHQCGCRLVTAGETFRGAPVFRS
jgi:hypothetical protein